MTRLPRDVSGEDLIAKLRELGYHPTRQTGSHVRLIREDGDEIAFVKHREMAMPFAKARGYLTDQDVFDAAS